MSSPKREEERASSLCVLEVREHRSTATTMRLGRAVAIQTRSKQSSPCAGCKPSQSFPAEQAVAPFSDDGGERFCLIAANDFPRKENFCPYFWTCGMTATFCDFVPTFCDFAPTFCDFLPRSSLDLTICSSIAAKRSVVWLSGSLMSPIFCDVAPIRSLVAPSSTEFAASASVL